MKNGYKIYITLTNKWYVLFVIYVPKKIREKGELSMFYQNYCRTLN